MAKINCVSLPIPPLPTLPTGFSIPKPPLPPIPNLDLCCQIHPEDYIAIPPIPPLVLPPAVMKAVNKAMATAMQAIQTFTDMITPECPKLPKKKT